MTAIILDFHVIFVYICVDFHVIFVLCVQVLQLCVLIQALSEALLQVRAELVETAQRTVRGVAEEERQLMEKKTTQLQVNRSSKDIVIKLRLWGLHL